MYHRTIKFITGTLTALALWLSAGIAAAAEQDAAAGFREACTRQATTAGNSMTIAGTDGWLFLANELRHVGVGQLWGEGAAKVSKATRPQDADPLPAILDFKRQLDTLGIELILVPVPPKAIIYPDKVADAVATPAEGKVPARLDAVHVTKKVIVWFFSAREFTESQGWRLVPVAK